MSARVYCKVCGHPYDIKLQTVRRRENEDPHGKFVTGIAPLLVDAIDGASVRMLGFDTWQCSCNTIIHMYVTLDVDGLVLRSDETEMAKWLASRSSS